MFSKSLLSVAIASAAIAFGANALACSTIIVGKDVSKTGTVIIGHNEDNGGRIIAQQHWVPAQTHKAGEMIKFEKSAAEIPQAEKNAWLLLDSNLFTDRSFFLGRLCQ